MFKKKSFSDLFQCEYTKHEIPAKLNIKPIRVDLLNPGLVYHHKDHSFFREITTDFIFFKTIVDNNITANSYYYSH